MTKNYETVFISTPVLSEEQAKETAKKFKSLLSDNGAKILNDEFWGLKKLAYPIQKKSTGFYHLLEFATEKDNIIPELELTFKRDERIMRFLTVALDKDSLAYSEKRRNRLKGIEHTPERKVRKERAKV